MKLLDIVSGTSYPHLYRIAFLTIFAREPLLRHIERKFGIIRPEWTVLLCLNFREGANARDICEITEQPSNTISRAVNSLQKRGLIVSKPDRSDGRKAMLHLTEAGQHLHDEIVLLVEEAEGKMVACLSADEIETLDGLLEKLARAVPEWS
jgi:DNA-binding MarR family transcriptional regulator